MKTPTLDQLLLERMNGRGKPIPKRCDLIILATVLLTCYGWAIDANIHLVAPSIVTLTTICFLLATIQMRECAWREQVHQIVEDTTAWTLQEKARSLYGWGVDTDLAILECHQSHMVGDCPLCGAT